MHIIVVGFLIFLGFLFYVKIKKRADKKVLVGRAKTKIDNGDLESAKELIFKAKEKGVKKEIIEELIQQYENMGEE